MNVKNYMLQPIRAALLILLISISIAEFIIDIENSKKSRNRPVFLQRLDWDTFVSQNHFRPLFRRHLRMDYSSFCKLLSLIDVHQKEVDPVMAFLRGGAVIKEMRLYATIRYLAGASYSDICFFCGISKPTFYRVLWETIDSINKTLIIKFPESLEDCATLAAGFETKSYDSILKNVVGALDGYLVNINCPKKKIGRNVRSYFSGHYQRYGINMQACCDSDLKYTYMGVGGPGVIKDRMGIKESGLFDKVENLPQGYVVIGDSAYQPTERLVSIFGGELALLPEHDNFNYYASQLRIRIEMAFGLMTRKWGILQRPLSVDVENVKHIMLAIARLHNFCIDERLATGTTNDKDTESRLNSTQLAYMNMAAALEYEDILSNEYPQWSQARERLVYDVKQRGLKRPDRSVLKKKRSKLS